MESFNRLWTPIEPRTSLEALVEDPSFRIEVLAFAACHSKTCVPARVLDDRVELRATLQRMVNTDVGAGIGNLDTSAWNEIVVDARTGYPVAVLRTSDRGAAYLARFESPISAGDANLRTVDLIDAEALHFEFHREASRRSRSMSKSRAPASLPSTTSSATSCRASPTPRCASVSPSPATDRSSRIACGRSLVPRRPRSASGSMSSQAFTRCRSRPRSTGSGAVALSTSPVTRTRSCSSPDEVRVFWAPIRWHCSGECSRSPSTTGNSSSHRTRRRSSSSWRRARVSWPHLLAVLTPRRVELVADRNSGGTGV